MSLHHAPIALLVLLLCAVDTASGGNLLGANPARNPDGSVNALIEIPAGTNAKWEVNEEGVLEWEMKDGKPRVVKYLAYPGSYGMVPSTLQSAQEGGDGDPLDVIVLGPAVERGKIVPVRLIGVLRLKDDGEVDDKLVAVRPGEALGDITSLAELDGRHPGISQILEIWFENYKGPGRIASDGFAEGAEALRILDRAAAAFERERGAP